MPCICLRDSCCHLPPSCPQSDKTNKQKFKVRHGADNTAWGRTPRADSSKSAQLSQIKLLQGLRGCFYPYTLQLHLRLGLQITRKALKLGIYKLVMAYSVCHVGYEHSLKLNLNQASQPEGPECTRRFWQVADLSSPMLKAVSAHNWCPRWSRHKAPLVAIGIFGG